MPVPYAITRQDAGLLIDWEPDGHQAFYPARALRLACGCAACADEMSGRPLLDPATVPADIRPVEVSLVGGYGLQVRWSDGHGTGIYTFQHLHDVCPCDRCRTARAARASGRPGEG